MGKIDTETKAFMSDPAHFADAFNYLITDAKLNLTVEEGTVNMCEAMQQKEKRFIAIGEVKGQLKTLASLVKKNRMTLSEAADEAGMTVEEFVEKTGVKVLAN